MVFKNIQTSFQAGVIKSGSTEVLITTRKICVLFISAKDAGSCCDSEEEQEEEEEEVQSTERAGADQRYDEQMDEAAEEEGLKRYREARANEMFPDEVDTPLDTPARIRSVLLLLSRMRYKCVSWSHGCIVDSGLKRGLYTNIDSHPSTDPGGLGWG